MRRKLSDKDTKCQPPSEAIFVAKRGRPTKAQAAAIEKTILSVARGKFLEFGYASTSMEAVAAEAGVSKGTLYARYPAKSDLFRAIVSDRIEQWTGDAAWKERERGRPVLTDGIGAYLMEYGVAYLAALDEPEVAAFDRLIRLEAARFPELAAEFREQGLLVEVKFLASQIVQSAEFEGWPVRDPEGVAEAFTAALLGWAREEAVRGDEARDGVYARYVGRLVALFVGGRAAW
ncbi:TetR/AcrR family transcriptional regulator [Novosphingobium sp. 1949]|uniref:TetR/AcrR family transcriptional regulator n=1 Tax=Novosphingobium organovorum TaxID=2930092 RepID=A0ABT0BCV7_9SPHN|nr:TetR/AcrR family transcriptional regulator [Novosphingobium organovorum]MCJ2182893.1 TetR/AcrR family transcriptional regulator [Novosphingobium organovorum]